MVDSNPRTQKPKSLLDRILGRSDISINGDVYMHRWRLIHTKWFGVRIHHILRSDSDREYHDHPFTFLSLILKGGYLEHRPGCKGECSSLLGLVDLDFHHKLIEPCAWAALGSLVFRHAEDLHRLELPEGKTAWTLVIRGPVRRQWGFMTSEGWVRSKDFYPKRPTNNVCHQPQILDE